MLYECELPNALYKDFFHNCLEGIIIATPEGRILDANPTICELLGYTREELLVYGRNVIIDKEDPRTQLALAHRATYGFFKGELTFIRKDGIRVPIEIISRLFKDKTGKKFASIVIRDVTQLKKLEEEITRLDRLNLIGEMAASLGHEIRNPLTTIRGFLQMFQSKQEYEHNRHYFDLMIEELDRANLIISEFLSLAKNKILNLKPTSLNQIITNIYPLILADVTNQGHNIELELNCSAEIMADEGEIRQYVLNIIRNALEAMPEPGTVTISTYWDCDNIILSIKDTGTGIPKEIYEQLGKPFVTSKEAGTGLGIPVCYRIAQRHNAKIEIETSSSGTNFLLKF